MTYEILFALAALASAGGGVHPTGGPVAGGAPRAELLRTDYARGRTFRVERVSTGSQRTVELEMELDGEPVDHPPSGDGGRASVRTEVFTDRVTELEGGVPTAVTRTYEQARIESGPERLEESSPVEGEELLLTLDTAGQVAVEAPGLDDELLSGQGLALALDALLPPANGEPLEDGESWELDADAIARGLGLEVAAALFPRPELDFDELRARGQRGEAPPAFVLRDSALSLLLEADWEASATLTDEVVEEHGVRARVIELELEGSGAFEGDGTGSFVGRGRAAGPVPAGVGTAGASEYELELEGRLLFSADEARPVALELEGSFVIETDTERDMGGSSFSMHSVQEGSWRQTVLITVEE